MKNLFKALLVIAFAAIIGFLAVACEEKDETNNTGTPAGSTWGNLSIPSGTNGLLYNSFKGKNNVLRVSPSAAEYGWTVLQYNLAAYSGKTVEISISVDVWLDEPAKIAWQANLSSTFPIIAGNTATNLNAGQWITIQGSNTISVPAGGGTLYLSGGGSGGQLAGNAVPIYFANFTLTITEDNPITEPTGVFLTIGNTLNLNDMLPAEFDGKTVTWASSNNTLVFVSANGIAEARGINTRQTSTFVSGAGTGTVTITASATGVTDHAITVTATTEALVNLSTLPPLKDQFTEYFIIGNIVRGASEISGTGANAVINNTQLTRHFNALTMENNMKPSYLITGRNASTGVLTWNAGNRTIADNFVDATNNLNMAVIGHTLLWHSQNANWMWDQVATKGNNNNPTGIGTNPGPGVARISKEEAIVIMRAYITEVAGRYAGRIHTWDVLNEIFPDSAAGVNMATVNWKDAMRNGKAGEGQDGNPWYIAIGSDFVYEGFLAARLADPNAILYYNDYNTDDPNRARLIRDMVKDVNDRYLALPANQKPAGDSADRLLIEGIGMQEHHNLGITAARIKTTIDLFRAMSFSGSSRKIRLSVSELDIIAYPGYNDFSNAGGAGTNAHTSSTVTNNALVTQANLYRDYMKLYMDNADLIERVSLWGVTDNTSWRSRGLPLLFDHNGRAKPAYYRFVGALD